MHPLSSLRTGKSSSGSQHVATLNMDNELDYALVILYRHRAAIAGFEAGAAGMTNGTMTETAFRERFAGKCGYRYETVRKWCSDTHPTRLDLDSQDHFHFIEQVVTHVALTGKYDEDDLDRLLHFLKADAAHRRLLMDAFEQARAQCSQRFARTLPDLLRRQEVCTQCDAVLNILQSSQACLTRLEAYQAARKQLQLLGSFHTLIEGSLRHESGRVRLAGAIDWKGLNKVLEGYRRAVEVACTTTNHHGIASEMALVMLPLAQSCDALHNALHGRNVSAAHAALQSTSHDYDHAFAWTHYRVAGYLSEVLSLLSHSIAFERLLKWMQTACSGLDSAGQEAVSRYAKSASQLFILTDQLDRLHHVHIECQHLAGELRVEATHLHKSQQAFRALWATRYHAWLQGLCQWESSERTARLLSTTSRLNEALHEDAQAVVEMALGECRQLLAEVSAQVDDRLLNTIRIMTRESIAPMIDVLAKSISVEKFIQHSR